MGYFEEDDEKRFRCFFKKEEEFDSVSEIKQTLNELADRIIAGKTTRRDENFLKNIGVEAIVRTKAK